MSAQVATYLADTNLHIHLWSVWAGHTQSTHLPFNSESSLSFGVELHVRSWCCQAPDTDNISNYPSQVVTAGSEYLSQLIKAKNLKDLGTVSIPVLLVSS